jgi:hypothetical protein
MHNIYVLLTFRGFDTVLKSLRFLMIGVNKMPTQSTKPFSYYIGDELVQTLENGTMAPRHSPRVFGKGRFANVRRPFACLQH